MKLLGKTGIEVFEYPGYVTTRVILPFLNEAMYVVMEGVATAEAVDTSMRLGYGLPVGPLALADRMGLDEVMRWMQHLFDELGDVKYRPCPLLRKMIRGGKLGVKSGSGFFEYDEDGDAEREAGAAPTGSGPPERSRPRGRAAAARRRRAPAPAVPAPSPTTTSRPTSTVTRRILAARIPRTAPHHPRDAGPRPRRAGRPRNRRDDDERLALRYLAAVEKMQGRCTAGPVRTPR